MADSFNERRKGYEAKWSHDEDLRFRVMNRRNKLLGLWAAGETGKTGAAADDYAKTVVAADFEEKGDDDVFRKVRADLPASVQDTAIRAKMDELLLTAHEQVTTESK